jgi:dipeptidyl aminopeptidase/acylaminoacyl peptidase
VRQLTIAFALLLSCTVAPAASSQRPPTATAGAFPPASATLSPTAKPLDMSIVPAGQISGAHALVVQYSQQPGGANSATRFWDVALDGSAPKQLLAYNAGEQLLTGYDYFDFARQLSPDGRQLVLTDPVDMAGTGLLVVDLVAGTTRKIATSGAAGSAAWSPDGQRIAYRGFTIAGPFQKESGIWVVPASGGVAERAWTSDRAAGSGATTIYGWTDDGAAIAFARDSTEVSIVDVRTKAVMRMSGPIHGIAWRAKRPSVALVVDDPVTAPSPSGPRGAPSSIGHPGHVEVRETTLGAPSVAYRYDDVGTLLWDPRWSPTSDEVALYWVCGAGATERDEIVVVDAVAGARRVLPTPGCVRSVSWSADGSKILYADLAAVRVRNADGSNDRELFRPGLPPGAFQQYVGAVTAFAPR